MRLVAAFVSTQGTLKLVHLLSSAVLAASGACLLYLLHIYTSCSHRIELAVVNQATIELVRHFLLPSAGFCIASGVVACITDKRAAFSCRWIITKGMNAVMLVALGTTISLGLDKLADAASDLRGVDLAGYHFDAQDVLKGDVVLTVAFLTTVLLVLYNALRHPCADTGSCDGCRHNQDSE